MKKVLTIPLIVIALFSGLTVNLATHYCMEVMVATKISLSGQLASCGMECDMESVSNPEGENISAHTCSNEITSYTFSSNYFSSSNVIKDAGNQLVEPFLPAAKFPTLTHDLSSPETNKPPGSHYPNKVHREVICIFRI